MDPDEITKSVIKSHKEYLEKIKDINKLATIPMVLIENQKEDSELLLFSCQQYFTKYLEGKKRILIKGSFFSGKSFLYRKFLYFWSKLSTLYDEFLLLKLSIRDLNDSSTLIQSIIEQNSPIQSKELELILNNKSRDFKRPIFLLVYCAEDSNFSQDNDIEKLLRGTERPSIFKKVIVLSDLWKADLIENSYELIHEIDKLSEYHLHRFLQDVLPYKPMKSMIYATSNIDLRNSILCLIDSIRDEKPLIFKRAGEVEFSFCLSKLCTQSLFEKANTPEDVIKLLLDSVVRAESSVSEWYFLAYRSITECNYTHFHRVATDSDCDSDCKELLNLAGFREALCAQYIVNNFDDFEKIYNSKKDNETWYKKIYHVLPFVRNLDFKIYWRICIDNKPLLGKKFENLPNQLIDFIQSPQSALYIKNQSLEFSHLKMAFLIGNSLEEINLHQVDIDFKQFASYKLESLQAALKKFSLYSGRDLTISDKDIRKFLLNFNEITHLSLESLFIEHSSDISNSIMNKTLNLKCLHLNNCHMEEEEWKCISKFLTVSPFLEELDFSNNIIRGEAFEKILQSLKESKNVNNSCKLKKLLLSNCSVNYIICNLLTNSLDFLSDLVELDMSYNPGIENSNAYVMISKLLSCPNLTNVDFSNCNLKPNKVNFTMLTNPNLKLKLDGLVYCRYMAFSLNNQHDFNSIIWNRQLEYNGFEYLETLYINEAKFTNDAISIVRDAFSHNKIKNLIVTDLTSCLSQNIFDYVSEDNDLELFDLSGNILSTEAVHAIWNTLERPHSVKKLFFADCSLPFTFFRDSEGDIRFPDGVEELKLSGNRINSTDVANIILRRRLKKIWLSRCSLNVSFCEKILNGHNAVKGLASIDISYNYLGNDVIKQLLTSLHESENLDELYIYKTGITKSILLHLFQFIDKNRGLRILNSPCFDQVAQFSKSEPQIKFVKFMDDVDSINCNLIMVKTLQSVLKQVIETKVLKISEKLTPIDFLKEYLDLIISLELSITVLDIQYIKYEKEVFEKLLNLKFTDKRPTSLIVSRLRCKRNEYPIEFFTTRFLPKMAKVWQIHFHDLKTPNYSWYMNLSAVKSLRQLSVIYPYTQSDGLSFLAKPLIIQNRYINHLNLAGNVISNVTLEALKTCTHLRSLNFWKCKFQEHEPEIWKTIIEQNATTLISLDLGLSNIQNSSLEEIIGAFTELEEFPLKQLGLRACELTSNILEKLSKVLEKCKVMKLLDLSANKLTDTFLIDIGRKSFQSFQWFLKNTKPDSEALKYALNHSENIQVLSLSENKNFDNKCLKVLETWVKNSNLKELFVHDCRLTASCGLSFAKIIRKHANLNLLSASGNNIGDNDCRKILKGLKSSKITILDLDRVGMTEAIGTQLRDSVGSLKNLTYLSLNDNPLGDDCGMHLLISLIGCSNLKFLYLNNCGFTSKIEKTFLKLLKLLTKLSSLSLNGNNFEEKSYIEYLSLINCTCTKVSALSFEECKLTKNMNQVFRQSFMKLTDLEYLSLKDNPDLDEGLFEIIYVNFNYLRVRMDDSNIENSFQNVLYSYNKDVGPISTIVINPGPIRG
ncbi:DgyrCDS3233 [Dimorphilus gyrociliatus]|uniref:DgyrCDS3233 n=1 Tax=Dimorphilus gyrociliatus TaxID=2664684 RepID=A0A7I8VFM0_9ANNE|nr:DgyrCDS3233 [Dimorphilus gyrociliatus]